MYDKIPGQTYEVYVQEHNLNHFVFDIKVNFKPYGGQCHVNRLEGMVYLFAFLKRLKDFITLFMKYVSYIKIVFRHFYMAML